jgi:hypothetical protein
MSEFMKKSAIIFLLILETVLGFGQATQNIRGTLTDQASKSPVPFASVILLNTDPIIGTTTDSDGNFKLENVPVGRYDLQVSFVGYDPVLIKELVVSSSKETYIEVSMKESVTTLDEIVVKPTVTKELALNTTTTVSARMLSIEEAKRYAGGFDDPARLASSFAGVASNVADNGIVIRGNAPKSLQWKLEGVEIPNPNHFADLSAFGGGGITALSSQMLANSDFLTGAFPAEYNNATSGVFDLFMRKGNNQKAEHTFQFGLIGIDASSEGPFKKGGKSSYLFNYRYATLSLMEPLLPEDAGGTTYQDLSFKLNFPTKNAGTFSLWGIGLTDGSGQSVEKDSTKRLYFQDREEADTEQFMGATGLNHVYFFNKKTHLETTLAATIRGIDWKIKRMNQENILLDQSQIKNTNQNFVFKTVLNKKISAKHNNKTGFVITGLQYDMKLNDAGNTELPPVSIVDENGFSTLLSAYTNSSFNFSHKLSMNVGLNAQLFTLNNNYTIEPRLGLIWYMKENQQIALAYGLHSRLERLNYYFSKSPRTGDELINKDMDFSKSHHFVLSYSLNISENMLLKIEPYYQQLFDVPVVADSSFSFINLHDQWFFNEKLENTGKGRNYGIDITLEKYMSQGYYFLLTASIFNSEYQGGDDVWRDTKYNRNYLINFLIGKEWMLGKNKQNVLGLNTRFTYQGGERYSPIDEAQSLLEQDVIYDETRAFSKQTSPSFVAHFTASYKINKSKSSHEFALKILNATSYEDFLGFRYNFKSKTIDEHREAIMIPNLSYKIEF